MSYFDHFTGSLDARWTAVVAAAGTVTVTDSFAKILTGATADAAFIHSASKLDMTKWQTITVCSNHQVTGSLGNLLFLVNRATAPVAAINSTFDTDVRLRISFSTISSVLGMTFNYFDASHVRNQWNGTTNAWTTGTAHAYALFQDHYEVTLEIDGPGSRLRILARNKSLGVNTYNFEQGLRYFAITDWVLFSGMETMTDLWLVLGDPITDSAQTGEQNVEYVRLADGTRDHLWVDQKDASADLPKIKHWHTFDGEFSVPQDRSTLALDVGTGGTWDDVGVKAGSVVLDGSTYHMVYAGDDGAGFQLGHATATSLDGPWTKFGSNPIVARGTGHEASAQAPYLNLDNGETDANKRAKLIYASLSATDSKWRLYYRTAPDPDGPWSAATLVLGPGAASAYDEFGWSNPVFKWLDGQWELWGATLRGTGLAHEWDISRATGASLTALTKDAANPIIAGRVDAKEDLTADLNGRIATMASTAGFTTDGVVLADKNATADDYSVSRIRKVNAGTLELYHTLKGFELANAAHVRQANAGAVTIQELRQVGGEWWVYASLSAVMGGHATFNAFHETTALYTATDRAGPYTIRWRATPVTGTGQWGNKRSSENLAFLRTPIASTPPGGGGTQPRRLRMYEGY